MNLLPETGADTGNYWCTWDTQYRMNTVEDGKITLNLRDILDESFLFGRRGLLNGYFEHIRKDIYVLLDNGWDVPRHIPGNGEISAFGSLILNEERFPGFPGEPQERLRKMKERITQLGYRGLGLWICANAAGERRKSRILWNSQESTGKKRLSGVRRQASHTGRLTGDIMRVTAPTGI